MSVDLRKEVDKADYALLNAVSLDQWAAHLLAGDVPMEAIMNTPTHGLGAPELAEHFFRLWNSGLIECSISEESGHAVPPDFQLARKQFVRTKDWPPKSDDGLVYRLSKEGGAVWEYFAAPDWSKFFTVNSNPDSKECELTSADRKLVEALRKCRYYHPPPIQGTDRWTMLRPWSATYWKTLPSAHRLTFRFESYDWPPRNCDLQSDGDVEAAACQRVTESSRLWCKSFDKVREEHFSKSR